MFSIRFVLRWLDRKHEEIAVVNHDLILWIIYRDSWTKYCCFLIWNLNACAASEGRKNKRVKEFLAKTGKMKAHTLIFFHNSSTPFFRWFYICPWAKFSGTSFKSCWVWVVKNSKFQTGSMSIWKIEEANLNIYFQHYERAFHKTSKTLVGQLRLLKPWKLAKVWEEENQKTKTISFKFAQPKETNLNLSSNRFDQAIQKTSAQLLGKVLW